MAILFMDGFDWYPASNLSQRWPTTVSPGAASMVSGVNTRFGLGQALACVNVAGGITLDRDIGVNANPVVMGFALKTPVLGSGARIRFNEPGIIHVEVRINANGSFQAYRNTTSIGTSGTGLVLANTWHYIEIKVNIADGTAGYVTVRVDGVQVWNLTGQDTRNAGTGVCRFVGFNIPGSAESMYLDDVYVLDTTGSAPNNDFLGDRRIELLRPSAAGDSTQFTPSAGSNWECVDDAPHNSDTDYVESDTAGRIDLYNVANPSVTPTTVNAVQAVGVARKTDTATRQARLKLKRSSTVDGSTVTLASDYALMTLLRETDPATGVAWTSGNVNDAQVGVEIVT